MTVKKDEDILWSHEDFKDAEEIGEALVRLAQHLGLRFVRTTYPDGRTKLRLEEV